MSVPEQRAGGEHAVLDEIVEQLRPHVGDHGLVPPTRKPADCGERAGICLGAHRSLAPIDDRWWYGMADLGGEIATDPYFDRQPVDAPAALGTAALDRAAELETVDEIVGIDVD